jgi:hypothetical protein
LTKAARVTDANEIIEALAGINAWDYPIITTRQDQTIQVKVIRSFNNSSRKFLVVSKQGAGLSIHLDDISQVEQST